MAIDTRFLTPDQAAGVQQATDAVANLAGKEPAATPASAFESVSKALLDKVMGETGVVTSEDTGFEKAIAETQRAGEASRARIESQAGREIAFAEEQFGVQKTGLLEGGRGFARNNAAIAQLDARTEKSLKDMEQRKQELLLAGEESTARQVSQLMVQEMQFNQQATQQQFANLLGLGNFAINAFEAELKSKTVVGLEAKDVALTTDVNGVVTATNKVTGEVLWQKRIGRAGQASPNITVSPVADPITGDFKYTEVRDKDTGEVRFLDAEGNEVDPATVQLEEGKDSLDLLIDNMVGDIVDSIIGGA